jgi:hypothetical protein
MDGALNKKDVTLEEQLISLKAKFGDKLNDVNLGISELVETTHEVKEQLSETTQLCLQLIEVGAQVIPVVGGGLSVLASIFELPFIVEDLKKKIIEFYSELFEYANSIIEANQELIKIYSENITKLANLKLDVTQMQYKLKEVKHNISQIITNIITANEYLKKVFDKDTNQLTNTSMLSSTTTINSNIDEFRITITSNMVVLLANLNSLNSQLINAINNDTTKSTIITPQILAIQEKLNNLDIALEKVETVMEAVVDKTDDYFSDTGKLQGDLKGGRRLNKRKSRKIKKIRKSRKIKKSRKSRKIKKIKKSRKSINKRKR